MALVSDTVCETTEEYTCTVFVNALLATLYPGSKGGGGEGGYFSVRTVLCVFLLFLLLHLRRVSQLGQMRCTCVSVSVQIAAITAYFTTRAKIR